MQIKAEPLLQRELVDMIPALRARARFLVPDKAAADDLVHDVVERALLARDRVRSGTNVRAWLNAIMRNLAVDLHRRRARDARLAHGVPDAPRPSYSAADLLSLEDIQHALSSLRSNEREIFSQAYFEGQSYLQISSKLGVPINTIATRLHRVRQRLRPLLAEVYRARLASLNVRAAEGAS